MSVGGVFSQMALTQLHMGMKMLKADAQANQEIVNMISEMVDQTQATLARGNNINITV